MEAKFSGFHKVGKRLDLTGGSVISGDLWKYTDIEVNLLKLKHYVPIPPLVRGGMALNACLKSLFVVAPQQAALSPPAVPSLPPSDAHQLLATARDNVPSVLADGAPADALKGALVVGRRHSQRRQTRRAAA